MECEGWCDDGNGTPMQGEDDQRESPLAATLPSKREVRAGESLLCFTEVRSDLLLQASQQARTVTTTYSRDGRAGLFLIVVTVDPSYAIPSHLTFPFPWACVDCIGWVRPLRGN